MTRFARAKGSKASNERVPENATSWNVMKTELEKSQSEAKTEKDRQEMNKKRQSNYNEFIEKSTKVEKKWADFPNTQPPNKKSKKNNNAIDKEMVKEMLKPDPDIDARVAKLKKEIDQALTEQKEKTPKPNKVKANKVKNFVSLPKNMKKIENGNDAPEEMNAKIQPKEIIVSKKKNKKQVLKIGSVVPNTTNDEKESAQENVAEKQENTKSPKSAKQNGNFNKKDLKNKQNNKPGNKDGNKRIKNEKDNNELNQKGQKRKIAKERDNKEHKRRKPVKDDNMTITIDGKKEDLAIYQGFPILKSDHDRLVALRKTMISKGIPKSEVEQAMKLQRRRAEKHLSKMRRVHCFNCRQTGHLLSDCPELKGEGQVDTIGSGICFKCGSTEHKYTECRLNKSTTFKFAHCFICREQGHLARECPDNPKGLYPNGGACKLCGDVTHLKKDCPTHVQQQQESVVCVNTIATGDVESLDDQEKPLKTKKTPTKKVVTF